jgi:hypothetical protein
MFDPKSTMLLTRASSSSSVTSWNTEKASTPTKVRWMGEAVPGREVYSSCHLPSSSGRVVGAVPAHRDREAREMMRYPSGYGGGWKTGLLVSLHEA